MEKPLWKSGKNCLLLGYIFAFAHIVITGGSLAQLVVMSVISTKLLYSGPG